MISKTAMITICGRPNVGKSTLTNALAGEKIAIVSNKPQTTRNRITAVCQRGETQFVFLDTPGFHKPRTRLGDYMVNVVRQSVADVDAVVLVVEPVASIGPQERELIASIKAADCPAVLAINKLDTVEPESSLPSSRSTAKRMPLTPSSRSPPRPATAWRSFSRSSISSPWSPRRSSRRA